ncbi:DMT family transporter [Phreatobacter sp. HK31-P]
MDLTRFIPAALAILWGLNWPAVKIALSEVPPFALRMTGLGAGALLLLAFAAMRGRSLAISRPSWVPLAIAGIFNIAAFNLATVFAQLNTTTSRAAILTFTTPLWAILLAYLFLGERPDRAKWMALAIGMTGIGILALPLATGGLSPLGLLFPMIAAVSWAAGSVYQKSHPMDGDRMVMTGYQLLLASAVAAVGYVASGEVMPTSLSTEAWIAIVFHVIGATALAYVLWFTLLARVSVAAASLTTLAIPVVGVIGAMTIVGERPAVLDYVGFAAVLAAAGVTLFTARPAPS